MSVTIDEMEVGDEPDTWRAAGFTVDDAGVCTIGQVRIRLAGRADGKRIRSWSLREIDLGGATTIDGIATTVSNSAMPSPGTHPNGALFIDHVVLFTPDVARTVAAFEALGIPALRTRATDTYGAPFVQTFFRAGEVILELIGPEEPNGDGPAGFFGLAHTVDDLDTTVAGLGEGVGDLKDAVQPGRQIATLRHKHFDMSVATALMSPEPAGAPSA